MVDPDGPDDSIIRRRRFACWITQAKNTHLLVFFVGGGGVLLTVHLSVFISVFNQLDAQNLFHNKFYFMPLHVSSTCAHHRTYRCDDTRGCVMQF